MNAIISLAIPFMLFGALFILISGMIDKPQKTKKTIEVTSHIFYEPYSINQDGIVEMVPIKKIDYK